MSAAGAVMVRWTSMRSVMGQIVSGLSSAAGRFGISVLGYTDRLMRNPAETFAAQPQTLRRAIAFIHDNAHPDIGLGDIATAIDVTPRAVQHVLQASVRHPAESDAARVATPGEPGIVQGPVTPELNSFHLYSTVVRPSCRKGAQWCGSVSQGRSPRG
jgi:hypothetical protein